MKGKNVLVVGLGRTGVATATRLNGMGATVTVTDMQPEKKLAAQLARLNSEIKISVGGHDNLDGVMFDLVVTSPGVDWNSPLLEGFRKAGVELISELELAYRLSHSKWVAVTGTNGKTTTTSIVGAILDEAGINTIVCGNIGNPAIGEQEVFETDKTVVAEVSSFQLEGVTSFAPGLAALLNITPDHLDRHKTMENYTRIKSEIFARQSDKDVCVINMDDPVVAGLKEKMPSRVVGFSMLKKLDEGAFVEDGKIVVSVKGNRSVIGDAGSLKIFGRPNLENALAACAIASELGVEPETIGKALFAFEGIPHRMEVVAQKSGVVYINDSKGTNVSATVKALEGIETPVVLILGGRDKEGDFAPLAQLIRAKNSAVVLIGEAAPKIAVALGDYPKIKEAETLEEAVETAAASASYGDTVLLSPACASFDMFKNYGERGDSFRRAVLSLNSNHGAINAN